MSWSARIAWFSTQKGKSFLRTVTGVAVIGGTLPYYLANGFCLDRYQSVVQMYTNAVGHSVPENSLSLYHQVCDDLKLTQYERYALKPFTVFGFDIFSAGTLQFRNGAIIGLPINFSYESTEDVNKGIKILNRSVDWLSEDGQNLQKSLVLSKNARKYAIAREIYAAQTNEVIYKTVYPGFTVSIAYFVSTSVNQSLNLYKGPLFNRCMIYTLNGLFHLVLGFFMFDYTTIHYEEAADEKASNVDMNYLLGGIEYYTAILERNKALRNLMGEAGAKVYSITGNENLTVRMAHLQTFTRKSELENKLKLVKEGKVDLGIKTKMSSMLGLTFIESSSVKPAPVFLEKAATADK